MFTIKTGLRPFTVPNFVLATQAARPRQEGFTEAPKYALSELPAETLADLCDKFRADVFARAGKLDPACEPEGTK